MRERPPRCDTCNGYGKAEGECPGDERLKAWPKDQTEIVPFEKLTDPVVAAIRFAYKLERKNKGKDIPYAGYALPGTAGNFGTCQHMTGEMMDYSEDDQGIDALHQLVAEAVWLGMEQQRRMMLGDKGEVFSSVMIGGSFRSDYAIGAAVEEALDEAGLEDGEQRCNIEYGVRSKLRDLDEVEALQERHSARVNAYLEEARERRAENPDSEETSDWNAMIKRVLGDRA